jgi:hypothetical protein
MLLCDFELFELEAPAVAETAEIIFVGLQIFCRP